MRKAVMTTSVLTSPEPTTPISSTLSTPSKAPLCWTARRWQHQALVSAAEQNGVSVNRLVLSICAGESYDFSGVEVYPSRADSHVMLLGDSDLIQGIRTEAKSRGTFISPLMRSLVFKDLGEAGKQPYSRVPSLLPARSYKYVNMAEGEYLAVRLRAEIEGTDMAKIVMSCIEGKRDRLEAEQSSFGSRWLSVGVRPLPEQWLALYEESQEAGMKFSTYLRSLVFEGVGGN